MQPSGVYLYQLIYIGGKDILGGALFVRDQG